MKKKISLINRLLVKRFGIPARKKKLPDPLDILIGTILSQNTNDKNSFKAYQNLREKFKSWKEVSKLSSGQIQDEIKVAGLSKQKAASIKQLLTYLEKKNKKINLDFIYTLSDDEIIIELTTINGIGVKTASCVLLFSLNRNICPVDTHVHRTLNRIGIVNTSSPEKTFYAIKDNLPDGIAHQFHTNLLRLGREICRPANPKCSLCPLLKICNYKEKILKETTPSNENKFMLLDNI